MKYQLVLQFMSQDPDDFDSLINLEEELVNIFGANHDVDGHDFGSGEMNIFILTNNPHEALQIAKESIYNYFTSTFKAAYRPTNGEEYEIIFPENSEE